MTDADGKKNVGSVGSGGPIATAGGGVITATGDRKFRAFDQTGKELWAGPRISTASGS
jgi:glucose dehydrogenase